MDKCLQQKCEDLNLVSQNLPEKPDAAVHTSVLSSAHICNTKPPVVSKEARAEALKSASLGAQQRTSVELVLSKVTGKDCHSALSSALHRHTGVCIVRLTQKHSETHTEAYTCERERGYFVFILFFCKVANC